MKVGHHWWSTWCWQSYPNGVKTQCINVGVFDRVHLWLMMVTILPCLRKYINVRWFWSNLLVNDDVDNHPLMAQIHQCWVVLINFAPGIHIPPPISAFTKYKKKQIQIMKILIYRYTNTKIYKYNSVQGGFDKVWLGQAGIANPNTHQGF